MQEALRRGRWTFLGPLGYLNAPRAMRESLIPDPERGAIVRRIFKQYATGTYKKQEVLQKATEWGLTNRRGQPLSSQAIGMLLGNRLYVGIIDVPEFGVRDQRGDFEPLISEEKRFSASMSP
jgi:Recombinase